MNFFWQVEICYCVVTFFNRSKYLEKIIFKKFGSVENLRTFVSRYAQGVTQQTKKRNNTTTKPKKQDHEHAKTNSII